VTLVPVEGVLTELTLVLLVAVVAEVALRLEEELV